VSLAMTVAACTSGASVLDGGADASACDGGTASGPDATSPLGCLDVLAGDGGLFSTGGAPGGLSQTGGAGTGGSRGTGGLSGTGAFGFGGAGASLGTGGIIGQGTGGFLLGGEAVPPP
jgi:hypothetical protein